MPFFAPVLGAGVSVGQDLFKAVFLCSGAVFSSAVPLQESQRRQVHIAWGDPVRAQQPDLTSGHFWVYAPDFFLEQPLPWWGFPYSQTLDLSAWIVCLETWSHGAVAQEGADFHSEHPHLFADQFNDLQREFAQGSMQKAVLATFLTAQSPAVAGLSQPRLVQDLLALCRAVSAGAGHVLTLYGVWNQSEGLLGATPEVLFSEREPGVVQTMALAGTRRLVSAGGAGACAVDAARLPDLSPDLLDDPKERHEHQLVIDGISNALARVSAQLEGGDVEVGKTSVLNLPSLQHLYTPIRWVAPRSALSVFQHFATWIHELHPTPALGAAPRDLGWSWLKKHKQVERLRFGAPFAVILDGSVTECVVAIRALQWRRFAEECELILGAGCGVVPASQLDREKSEVRGKMNAILCLFGRPILPQVSV